MKAIIGLFLSFVWMNAWGADCRFFRVGCTEGIAPGNIAITSGESGEMFLEFDTEDQSTYIIQATAHLDSSPVWGMVASVTGDGGRAKLPTAQRWSKTFGGALGDQANCVCQTSDGGYIVAGGTSSFGAGGGEVYLVKVDENGGEVWSRTFGGSKGDNACSVRQTSDGGYILAGTTWSFGAGGSDVYLVKVDENGHEVWKSTFDGGDFETAECVQQTSDGGYIMAGYTGSFGAGTYDVYLVKADENGGEMWSRTFGGSAEDRAYSVQQTSDGGYIVAGFSRGFDPADYSDCFLIKTDQSGSEVWSSVLGTPGGNDEAHCVQQTSDGGYILAGVTSSFGAGLTDVYLVKTDENGNRVWHTSFGGISYDEAYCVRQTSDGGYILAGRTESSGAGEYDVYLVKTSSDGNGAWDRTFGGSGRDQAYCVRQTFDGGYIVAGYTCSFAAEVSDVYLIKTDGDGKAPLPE